MSEPMDPAWVYNETVKMFAIGGDPPHEDAAEMDATWGRVWGLSNDVGQIRTVLMHRPGVEMEIVDPSKRIESIGSYGDLAEHWYFQSEDAPDIPTMQAQHDAFVAALDRLLEACQPVDLFVEGAARPCADRGAVLAHAG